MKNIDDENAEVADMSAAGDEESFVQVQKNIDGDNVKAAVVAHLRAQFGKDMVEDFLQKTRAGNQVGTLWALRPPCEYASVGVDEESTVQVKKKTIDRSSDYDGVGVEDGLLDVQDLNRLTQVSWRTYMIVAVLIAANAKRRG